MAAMRTTLAQFRAKSHGPGVRAFFLSIFALSVALLLALYSGAAEELGQLMLAGTCALAALAIAGWVAVTQVPTLIRRSPLRWIGNRIEYRVSREGWIYFSGLLLIALAALNTGNNLLFLILACLIALVLMSGILSSTSLSGIALRLTMPEHIFAGQPVRAQVELENQKLTLPSFSLRVEAIQEKGGAAAVLEKPVYFPYLPKHDRVEQTVPITFPKRGVYRQDAFRVITRFPFGFLQKARRMELKAEALVYPSVEPTVEFMKVRPVFQGALESVIKGRGQDLYALRDYVHTDSARLVHWKATARSGSLMVREFTREEDYRLLLVLDAHSEAGEKSAAGEPSPEIVDRFERAVALCASFAWHFYQTNSLLQFRSAGIDMPLAPAEETIFTILDHLAVIQPLPRDPEQKLISDLAASPELFKIIVTSQPRGYFPDAVWNSSYIVFLED
jgi:uncharacterized protein (DUF58 family)